MFKLIAKTTSALGRGGCRRHRRLASTCSIALRLPRSKFNRVPWAIALWDEEHHADGAAKYVADEIGRLAVEGDKDGAALPEPARQSHAIRGKKRCRLHWGLSTGAPKGNRNAWKHGRYSQATRDLEAQLRSVLASADTGLASSLQRSD